MVKNILRVLKIKTVFGIKEKNEDYNQLNNILGKCSLYKFNDTHIHGDRYLFGIKYDERVDVKFIILINNNTNETEILYYTFMLNDEYPYDINQEIIMKYFDEVWNIKTDFIVEYMSPSVSIDKLTLIYK